MMRNIYVDDAGGVYRVDGKRHTPLTDADVDGLDTMLERQERRIRAARMRLARRDYTLVDEIPHIKDRVGGEGISRQRRNIPGKRRHG